MSTCGLPWTLSASTNVKQRVHHLEKVLTDAKAAEAVGNPDECRKLTREYYTLLCPTWERAVEEILFNKVLQRLETDTNTRSLARVHVDSESVESVFSGMTRASLAIDAHGHAVAANTSLPTVKDMTDNLEALKDFVKKQKDKTKKSEQRHTHLKSSRDSRTIGSHKQIDNESWRHHHNCAKKDVTIWGDPFDSPSGRQLRS